MASIALSIKGETKRIKLQAFRFVRTLITSKSFINHIDVNCDLLHLMFLMNLSCYRITKLFFVSVLPSAGPTTPGPSQDHHNRHKLLFIYTFT